MTTTSVTHQRTALSLSTLVVSPPTESVLPTLPGRAVAPVVHKIDLAKDKDRYATKCGRFSHWIWREINTVGMMLTAPFEECARRFTTVFMLAKGCIDDRQLDSRVFKLIWNLFLASILIPFAALAIVGAPLRALSSIGERTFAYHQPANPMQPVAEGSIVMATFNTGLGPDAMGVVNGFSMSTVERARHIGKQLAESDAEVILLQEVFDVEAQQELLNSYRRRSIELGKGDQIWSIYNVLPNKGLPNKGFFLGSGLMVISRYPFEGEVRCWKNRYEDRMANKGCLMATINVGHGKRFVIDTTHLLAGTPSERHPLGTPGARQYQLHYMAGQVQDYSSKVEAGFQKEREKLEGEDAPELIQIVGSGDTNICPYKDATKPGETRNREWFTRIQGKTEAMPAGERDTGMIHEVFDPIDSSLFSAASDEVGTDFPARDFRRDPTPKGKGKFLDVLGFHHPKFHKGVKTRESARVAELTSEPVKVSPESRTLLSDHRMLRAVIEW